MPAPSTKAAIMAWAEARNILIEHEDGNHVHAYAPAGFRFSAAHNHTLWSEGYHEQRPDWRAIGKALEADLALVPCTDPDCDVCGG